MSWNLRCGWSMQPLRRILRLIHLLNVSWRKHLLMMILFFNIVVILLMMYAVLDFESKNLIAKNKRSYFPHVVDFSKFSQVVVNFTLFSFLSWYMNVISHALILLFFQSSCSSASPSFVSEDFLCSEVDRVLDKVVEYLISEATTIVASQCD